MASLLRKAGFTHLESLPDFSSRYPTTPILLDKTLSKIWICHFNEAEIPDENENDSSNYFQLYMIAKEKAFGDTTQFDFDVYSLFDKIYKHFGAGLTKYILTKCHIFYNWGINAFEPVINVVEVHEKLQNYQKRSMKEKKFTKKRFRKIPGKVRKFKGTSLMKQKKFKSNLARVRRINGNYKGGKGTAKFLGDGNEPEKERFTLNKILYSVFQLTQWPKNHILQRNSVEDLLKFIVNVKIEAAVDMKNYMMEDLGNWKELEKIFEHFLKEHSALTKNNGYGRVLENYLKQSKDFSGDQKLPVIPKTIVKSFIFDILRRVLPLDFFGKNSCRKKIFCSLAKILNGSKNATFTWESLKNDYDAHKSDIKWCQEVQDDFTLDRMILKIFKWLVKGYVFVILKSYFFVSETNSSDYELNFYRKSDVESASFFALNDLLYYKKLRKLKSSDSDYFTLERKWVDTGEVEEKDLDLKCKKFMEEDTKHVQPVASVRFLPKNSKSCDVRLITNIESRITKKFAKDDKTRRSLVKIFLKREKYRKSMVGKVKLFLEFLMDKVKTGIRPWPNNPALEAAWRKCYYLRKNFGKLYFVKADISDAFGSINHSKLRELLEQNVAESCGDFIKLKTIQEWKHSKKSIKLKTRFSFSKIPTENTVLIFRNDYQGKLQNKGKFLVGELLKILYQIIFRQRLKIKNKIYLLQEGVAQGGAGKFSPLLNEIYYSSMDRIFFGEFYNATDVVLIRGVDDYLFISPDLEKTKRFFEFVYNGIADYNARFSREKLLTNIKEDLKIIPYLGLIFNIDDMSVSPNYSKFEGRNLLSAMKLFDQSGDVHFKKFKFLEKRISLTNCLKLYSILFNRYFNSLSGFRNVIFDACLMQANRILVLIKYLFDKEIDHVKLHKIIFKSMELITNAIFRISKSVSKAEIKWLFSHAMLVIFTRFSGKFGDLLVLIKREYFLSENYFLINSMENVIDSLKEDINFFSKDKGVKDLFKNLAK